MVVKITIDCSLMAKITKKNYSATFYLFHAKFAKKTGSLKLMAILNKLISYLLIIYIVKLAH